MRRESPIDRTHRQRQIERARRMTPEGRLAACINLSRMTAELKQAGKRHRERSGS